MVVHFDTSTNCSLVCDMEQPTVPHPDLLVAKREPGTDSPKRCRPVSAKSALEPVDEEPSISDMKEKGSTTVDRGVGPTPLPLSLGDSALTNSRNPFASTFIPGSPLEQSAYQHSLAIYYAKLAGISPLSFSSPSPVGQPLSANTHEGRYLFNPPNFHHPSPARMVGSPTQSDISLFSNPALANSMDRLAAQMHWDRSQRQLQQMGSPFSLNDLTKKSSSSAEVPATPQSGSITLPPSLNSSRLTSPRPSLVSGRGRKRALSHSPLSEFLDIQSLTRSSEGSLHFTPLLHNTNSRSSSAASGSYGHLSAGSLASLTPTLKPTSPFLHPMYSMQLPFPMAPFQPPVSMHLNAASVSQQLLGQQMNAAQIKQENVTSTQMRETVQQPLTEKGGGSAVVSSTVPNAEELPPTAASTGVKVDAEDESQDFKETNCRWDDCTQQFPLHEDLVKHVNQDHISSNRKTFICRWRECCRQEKPFKAQYMLVVHMRRHTGEKPHKCQGFPGCNKAYSRLENLKTHMRSHTGERPYLCEYPGCQKAFSNASDRAKHQNRTHSNEKPYACEIDGCSKRYTDPSSLRKHVKTVHGAEFYARKKHKGLDTPGCRANNNSSVKSDNQRGVDRNCVEECLTVTGLGSNEHRNNQGPGSMSTDQQGSPQSDIDVGIHVMKEECIALVASPMDALQENIVEEVQVYNQQDEGGQSLLVTRPAQRLNSRNLKPKLTGKPTAITSLPSIPNVFIGDPKKKLNAMNGVGSSKLQPRRHLPEILDPSQKQSLAAPRRDSNTSTLSSYMSSVRSEHSPAMFNSRFSSRRSSETSQLSARLSIINSPYEYDIAGNLPDRSSREMNSVTDQMEKARLGSQPNLYVQSQSMNLLSPAARHDNLRRDFRRGRDNEGWRTATPAHTPLPHEYPQHERRRASDPVRCVDPNFSELKKLQQRYYSLNTMKPLPIPNSMKSLRGKKNSQETFHSSHGSMYANGYDANAVDYEAMLNIKMIEDNDDVIIPDDMKQFLQQRQAEQHLQQSRSDVQQGATTPTPVANGGNSVDEWVQQTNNVNHQVTAAYPHTRQAAGFDYYNTGHYPGPPQYGVAYDHRQHVCCNGSMYSNMNGDPCYGNIQPACHVPYQCHNMYPPGQMCHGSHPPGVHHSSACNHSAYNQTCVMPPPAVVPPPAPVANDTSPRHHAIPVNHPHPTQHMSTTTTYDNHRPFQVTSKATHHHMLVNQQLSPPCEVTSSTDRNPQGVPHAPMMDNMSSVSAADMQSQASHHFSSVSQMPPNHGDGSSNMVINNMSNVLSQFTEENKYLNSQH